MNIFYLSQDPEQCARYHCDAHVVKMILESAQMLCTVLAHYDIKAPYKPTHQHHPCTRWVAESLDNWLWLCELGNALDDEYRYRYNKTTSHRSYTVIESLPVPPLPDIGPTPVAQAMPEMYQQRDPVRAYRDFYAATKADFACWTKRPVPRWFSYRRKKQPLKC